MNRNRTSSKQNPNPNQNSNKFLQHQHQQQQSMKLSTFGAFGNGNEPSSADGDDDGNVNNVNNVNVAVMGSGSGLGLGDEELVNVVWKKTPSSNMTMTMDMNMVPSTQSSSSQSLSTSLGGKGINVNVNVDLSKEYGYQYEYTEEDEDDDDDDDDDEDDDDDTKASNNTNESNNSTLLSKIISTIDPNNAYTQNNNNNDPNNISYTINLLGKSYHPITDYTLRREYETNLFWFSYRCDFTPIQPQNLTSDAGWGCMLRSAQMLLGQALRVHYNGRSYIPPKSTVRRREHTFVQDLLMWMADYPSACTTGCWYSLHNMVAAGVSRYDVLPGEWFGPGTACYVLRDLMEIHERDWDRRYGQSYGQRYEHEHGHGHGHGCNQKGRKEDNGGSNSLGPGPAGPSNNSNQSRAGFQSQPHSSHSSHTSHTSHTSYSSYQRHVQPVMRVYVVSEGSIYRSEIEQLMTKNTKSTHSKNDNVDYDNNDIDDDDDDVDDDDDGYDKVDFDALVSDPLLHPLSDTQHSNDNTTNSNPLQQQQQQHHHQHHQQQQQQQKRRRSKPNLPPWDTSLLILIPLRLGLKSFQSSSYAKPLSHVLSFPQSIGFVGGAPRHALWFYGANSDGSKVYGLDPHTVQRAPRRRRLRKEEEERTRTRADGSGGGNGSGNGDDVNTDPNTNANTGTKTKQFQVQLTDEYLRSVNCPNISTMDMSRIDPSLALGFYCRNREDYEAFCSLVDQMKIDERTAKYPALFSITETRPDYTADLSSAMMDMMLGCGGDGVGNGTGASAIDILDDNGGNCVVGDDEDDFVML